MKKSVKFLAILLTFTLMLVGCDSEPEVEQIDIDAYLNSGITQSAGSGSNEGGGSDASYEEPSSGVIASDVTISVTPVIDVAEPVTDNKKEQGTSLDALREKYLATPTPSPEPEQEVVVTPEPTPETKIVPVIALIDVSDINFPTEIKLGRSFNLTGKISSIDGTINKLYGSVVKSDGEVIASVEEDLTSIKDGVYDIAKGEINKIKFGTLSLGKYTYKIEVSGENIERYPIVNEEFSVVERTKSGGDTYTEPEKKVTPTPVVVNVPTPTPTPTGGSTVTPTPVPTKTPTITPTPTGTGTVSSTGDSGDATFKLNNIEITTRVTVKGAGDRAAVLTGKDARDFVEKEKKALLDVENKKYVWVVVHVTTKTSDKFGFGNTNEFLPGILVRNSTGSKFSGGENIVYYVLNSKVGSFDQKFDIVFQVPSGQESKFNLVFGNGSKTFTYKYRK